MPDRHRTLNTRNMKMARMFLFSLDRSVYLLIQSFVKWASQKKKTICNVFYSQCVNVLIQAIPLQNLCKVKYRLSASSIKFRSKEKPNVGFAVGSTQTKHYYIVLNVLAFIWFHFSNLLIFLSLSLASSLLLCTYFGLFAVAFVI